MPFALQPLDQVSTTWNTEREEKLQEAGWLISTILVKFNHLRGMEWEESGEVLVAFGERLDWKFVSEPHARSRGAPDVRRAKSRR